MPGRIRQIETDPLRALYQRISDLESQLRELRAGRRAEATAIGRGGITVKDGGAVRVYAGNGALLAAIGDDISNFEAGRRGVYIGRANGAPALIASGAGDGDDIGFVGLYDQRGNYIVSDDVASGHGLARPYIPVPVGEVTPPTATTASATFVDVASGASSLQHPVLYAYLLVRASDATTAGEVRVTVDGTAVGPVATVTAGAYTFAGIGPFATGVEGQYADLHTVAVQARRTAGTGTVGVRVMSLVGLESSWA